MPFAVRITEWKDKPMPVLVIKERLFQDDEQNKSSRSILRDRGSIYGEPMRRCLPVFRKIVERVTDQSGIPLELQRYFTTEGLRIRGNLPLDEESGAKLALIFRLQDRTKDLDRVELIAYRIAQFTKEEASYWLSRTTHFGDTANRWAISGLRVMLCGHGKDKGKASDLEKMLEKYRISV